MKNIRSSVPCDLVDIRVEVRSEENNDLGELKDKLEYLVRTSGFIPETGELIKHDIGEFISAPPLGTPISMYAPVGVLSNPVNMPPRKKEFKVKETRYYEVIDVDSQIDISLQIGYVFIIYLKDVSR